MKLVFYYDVVCPYAYLASTQIVDLASRAGAELVYRPILLGGVLKTIGAPTVPMNEMSPGKLKHNFLDMQRWADIWGVPLTIPPEHPRRSVNAMRAIISKPEDIPTSSQALFAAYWIDGLDVSDATVVATVLNQAGLDGEEMVRCAQTETVKLELRERTDDAIKAGVFGVPAFVVQDQLFWGQDRLDFVEKALRGWKVAS